MRRSTQIVWPIAATLIASAVASAQDAAPSFRDYETPVYTGRHAEPDLSTGVAYTYRTRIHDAAEEPANFAGHYRVVTWGCGATCVAGVIYDLASGRVTPFPFTICCTQEEHGADFRAVQFRPTSRLISFTGLLNEQAPDATHYYQFARGLFVKVTAVPVKPAAQP